MDQISPTLPDSLDPLPNKIIHPHHLLKAIAILVMILLVGSYFICSKYVRTYDEGDFFQGQAVSNARQIGLGLVEFRSKYGKFPDVSTIDPVKGEATNSLLYGTTTSNQFFRQLIGSDIVQTEDLFYARIKGARMPDGDMMGAKALQAGECGFSYLPGASHLDSSRPILVTPLIPGTTRFDRDQFESKRAVILFSDNSYQLLSINKDGDVIINGKKLFDPTNTIWNGRPPVIAWPE